MKRFAHYLTESELASTIRRLKSAQGKSILFGDKIRKITPKEVELLEQNGCFSENWDSVFLAGDFQPMRLRNVHFVGKVVLGSMRESIEYVDGTARNTGIYNSTIANSEVGNECLIDDVKWLSNQIIERNCCIINVGEISALGDNAFGNGVEISVGSETGGRELKLFSDLTVELGTEIVFNRNKRKLQREYNDFIDEFIEKIKFEYGIISAGVVLIHTHSVRGVFIGKSAKIDGAGSIHNSTILSNDDESTHISGGALVKDSVIQWGSHVTSSAIVDSSLLCEHSHAERHGKVTQSIVGPNSGVAEGECTASLLGPFVGFHHQSLVIGALWPEGKGNVGYGANVGSNHTAKAPDQEILPGEGMFFGLGVNIKFPANYVKSPYTIIATGVDTLPQRVEFPFSLINTPAKYLEGISPAYNEIFPGWVLSNNIYMVRRNEGKYIKRNKARRNKFEFEVFRPEIVDMMISARERLKIDNPKPLYTVSDIPGLGKNYMTESSRQQGIEAYTFYIRYYALQGLFRSLQNGADPEILLEQTPDNARWAHEKELLLKEIPGKTVREYLEIYSKMLDKIAQSVLASKQKDDKRGIRIIDDYEFVHGKAENDGFVKDTFREVEDIKSKIQII